MQAIGGLAVGLIMLLLSTPAAGQPNDDTYLRFADEDTVEVELDDDGRGEFDVVLFNPGPKPVDLTMEFVPAIADADLELTPASLRAGYTSVKVAVDIGMPPSQLDVSVSHVVATTAGGPGPAIRRTEIVPDGPSSSVWWLIGPPAAAALVLVSGSFWFAVSRAPANTIVWWWNRMGPATWSFDKSWASTLTALVAAASAVSASTLLPDRTEHFSRNTYVGVSLMAGIAIIVAPLLYRVFARTARSTEHLASQPSPNELISLSVDGVPWTPVTSDELANAAPDAQVFTFDEVTGTVTFGDSQHGERPSDLALLIARFHDTRLNREVVVRAYAPPPRLLEAGEGWTLSGFVADPPAPDAVEYQGFVLTFLGASLLTLAAVLVQLVTATVLSLEVSSDDLDTGSRNILAALLAITVLLAAVHGARSTADNIRLLGAVPIHYQPPEAIAETQALLERLHRIYESRRRRDLPSDGPWTDVALWWAFKVLRHMPGLVGDPGTVLAIARLLFRVDRPAVESPPAAIAQVPWTVL